MKDSDALKAMPALQPDPFDPRDLLKIPLRAEVIPRSFSLREYGHPVFEQEHGSCAAYAATQMVWNITSRMFKGVNPVLISPFELYWTVRKDMGTLPSDSGSYMRAVFKILQQTGVIPWRYFPGNQDFRKAPPSPAVLRFKIKGYERIPVGNNAPAVIRQVLATERLPILIGIRIPARLMNSQRFADTGSFELPPSDVQESYGHAMMIDGYDAEDFDIVNSWGRLWARNGYGKMHESWFRDPYYCMDVWTLSRDHA